MSSFFEGIAPIRHEGTDSRNALAFRHYDRDRVVLGKRMQDHLRFAVCYWHSFCWDGNDPFGGPTLLRPWFEGSDALRAAELKAEVAFDFFAKLGTPYFCFHDRDVAPEGSTPRESKRLLEQMVERLQGHMQRTGVKLLWGTANLFSHRRYMSGAATNPDPAVFAFAAAQVKEVLEATHRMGGENYVLWGGREGYETLLNTDLKHEDEQAGRFLNLVVEHKHRIGFKGTMLIEPKPREPTKHQYDFDAATVHAFLQRHGLDQEVKLNIEANHATLAGHSFEHEIAYALANGIFGSVDMNRGDPQLGWDTDQFPNNVPEVALALYAILQGGGFGSGGINFDAKIRRQSIDAEDLFYGHIGAMDTCAQALLAAAAMLEDDALAAAVRERYAGWQTAQGQGLLAGKLSLADLSAQVLNDNREVEPRSGRQEKFENLVRRYV